MNDQPNQPAAAQTPWRRSGVGASTESKTHGNSDAGASPSGPVAWLTGAQRTRGGKSLWNKVPTVTAGFWVIKIMSTTVGETGADYLAVNAGFGKGVTSIATAIFLLIALFMQVRSERYTPWLYWLTVILVSVVGTQITDLLTDGLGVSLYVSTAVFAALLAGIFAAWYRIEGTLSILSIDTRRRELWYWIAILCTFALGTAGGDLATEALGLGFRLGAIAFAVVIGLIALARAFGANAVLAFWLAYILTRPLGAALGDLLSQAKTYGGLGLGPMLTSVIFLSIIAVLVGVSQRNASRPAFAGLSN